MAAIPHIHICSFFCSWYCKYTTQSWNPVFWSFRVFFACSSGIYSYSTSRINIREKDYIKQIGTSRSCMHCFFDSIQLIPDPSHIWRNIPASLLGVTGNCFRGKVDCSCSYRRLQNIQNAPSCSYTESCCYGSRNILFRNRFSDILHIHPDPLRD